jgi:hypothetical protein
MADTNEANITGLCCENGKDAIMLCQTFFATCFFGEDVHQEESCGLRDITLRALHASSSERKLRTGSNLFYHNFLE